MHRIGTAILCLILLNGCMGPAGEKRPNAAASDRMYPGAGADTGRPAERKEHVDALLAQETLTLGDLLNIAELNNPELAGSRDFIDAAQGRIQQAEMYPNPVLGLEFEDAPVEGFDVDNSTKKISITQPLILSRRRSAAISDSKIEVDSRRLSLENKRRELVGEIYGMHAELAYLKRAEVLYDNLLDLAGQTLSTATTRFEAKAVLEAEVIKSRIEVHELDLGKRRLSYQRSAVMEKLQAALGHIDVTADRIEGTLSFRLPDLDLLTLKTGVKNDHPRILAAQKNVEAFGYRTQQAAGERMPDMTIKVAYGRDEAAGEDIVEAGIGIPLPFFDTNKGRIHEARSLENKAFHDLEVVTGRLLTDLASAHAYYSASKSEVEIFKDNVVPNAEKSLAQIQEAYRAGRMELLDLLDAQRTHARTKLSLLESLKNANLAKAGIFKITGKIEEDEDE